MGTTISTTGLPGHLDERVESWFRYVERRLSRFLPDSELSRLNRSTGRAVAVSPLLYETMATASRYFHETGGLFNPYLGAVLCSLGYGESFEKIPAAGKVVTATAAPGAEEMVMEPAVMNPVFGLVTLLPGVAIDLGGIAKGWAAQTVRNWLMDEGVLSGLIDAGGDIAVWGTGTKTACEITIADPFHPEHDIAILELNRGAGIATSNTIRRKWAGPRQRIFHHIIDPSTGQSSRSDLVQATIVADDLTEAEVYTKCLLVLGSEKGPAWLRERRPDLGFVGVRQDGSVLTGPALGRYCRQWVVQD